MTTALQFTGEQLLQMFTEEQLEVILSIGGVPYWMLPLTPAEEAGLSDEEFDFALGTSYQPNAVHRFDPDLLAAWHAEDDAEAELADHAESRRIIAVQFRQLSVRFSALERNGFGGMIRELSNLLNGDENEFDRQRAEELISCLQSGASPCGNYR